MTRPDDLAIEILTYKFVILFETCSFVSWYYNGFVMVLAHYLVSIL